MTFNDCVELKISFEDDILSNFEELKKVYVDLVFL